MTAPTAAPLPDSEIEARLQNYAIELAEHGAGDEDTCRDCMKVLRKVWDEAAAALAQLPPRGAEAERLYTLIAHGDEKHRQWLREKCYEFFDAALHEPTPTEQPEVPR